MLISAPKGLSPCSEKRVEVQCDICHKITTTTFANYSNSQKRRGNPGTTYCRSCVCKVSAAKRRGKPAHNKGKKLPESMKGVNHPSWRGGRYLSSDGYPMVYIGHHAGDGWTAYQKEHVLIAEEMLGRPLAEGEVVHHIDGDKTNNDPENLWITTHVGHRNSHASLQRVAYELYRHMVIDFDRSSGTYSIREST